MDRRVRIMLKSLRVLLVTLLLVVGGASVAAATPGQPDQMVPVKGAGVGQDVTPEPGVFPGCSLGEGEAPLLWRFTSEGSGPVSHLGRVTYTFTHCTHVDFTITEGVMTFAAANGDMLVLNYTGEVTQYVPGDPDAFWEMSWTAASGTGRFAGASGTGDGSAVTHTETSPLAGTTDLAFHGMLAYDASNRAVK
jgi:hypothetical protein